MIRCNVKDTETILYQMKIKKRNSNIAVTRAGGERPFATYKQHYKLSRTRFLGLAKNNTFYGLAAIAANIRKRTLFSGSYGIPTPIILDRWV